MTEPPQKKLKESSILDFFQRKPPTVDDESLLATNDSLTVDSPLASNELDEVSLTDSEPLPATKLRTVL